jgi:2OG-Fe(II) oxygenase superfamily
MDYLNSKKINFAMKNFEVSKPFNYCVIDDFFDINIARQLDKEFPSYESEKWFFYKNAIENKKTSNDWNQFPALTYNVFSELISDAFVGVLSKNLGINLYPDPGLHGGGWHIHGLDGNLNPHLDYSIHPKLHLQRKLNIIIYLSESLKPQHGGHLGLWSHDENMNAPLDLIKEIEPKFNRAVLFDTTQNSWHGMSRKLTTPPDVFRKSLAVYYLVDPPDNTDKRDRALFAPRDFQKRDQNILDLIKQRSDSKEYFKAYKE